MMNWNNIITDNYILGWVTIVSCTVGIFAFLLYIYDKWKKKIEKKEEEKKRKIEEEIKFKQNTEKIQENRKNNVDTRFNNAVIHLGSENPSVVLGGIHTLHQIAVEYKNYTQVVHDLFCSYLRENSAKLYERIDFQKTPEKSPAIIQTLIDYLFKPYDNEKNIYNNYKADLSFSTLRNCDFEEIVINNVNFNNCFIKKCSFYNSNLLECSFKEVKLIDCDFWIATLINCDFRKGILTNCYFRKGFLTNCSFMQGYLTTCSFRENTLFKCNFMQTVLTNCFFEKGTLDNCNFVYKVNVSLNAELYDCNGLELVQKISTELPPNRITENTFAVRLEKLSELKNALYPNNIEVGFVEQGEFIAVPKIGECFEVGSNFNTSVVREIIDENSFKTDNSIYHWTLIKIKKDNANTL